MGIVADVAAVPENISRLTPFNSLNNLVIHFPVHQLKEILKMGLFDIFRKQAPLPDHDDIMLWANVAAKTAGTLWTLLNTDPKMLANPYARILLRDDWNVGVATSQCDPTQILGPRDVAFALLREDQSAYDRWVEGLKSGSPMFQQIQTEQFAKSLVSKLRERVEVAN